MLFSIAPAYEALFSPGMQPIPSLTGQTTYYSSFKSISNTTSQESLSHQTFYSVHFSLLRAPKLGSVSLLQYIVLPVTTYLYNNRLRSFRAGS